MKLFAFQPIYHAFKSFFVMAESEADARTAVDNLMPQQEQLANWGAVEWADVYEMTVAESGEVITNDNS